ncbi:RTC4-like domain-containing protein [Cercophora samala]|uniref:Restriction of telomere capping protein 4 n=1 Tax=Cercophora samala TaxID=330535 RepID=A0AA39ZC59_9PEZI|nr:RTC4-like domain-containing protein [Cercophora samala]
MPGMATRFKKVNPPRIPGRRAGLSNKQKVDTLLKQLPPRPTSEASQDTTDTRFPDSPSTQRPDNERNSSKLPDRLSSPLSGSDVEKPRRDPGPIPSSPVQSVIDFPIPSPRQSAPKSSQASTRGKHPARKPTESIHDSESDDDWRAGRSDIRSTDFSKRNQHKSAAVLISSDSKKVIPSSKRHRKAPKQESDSAAAPNPKDDVQEVEETAADKIFGKTKVWKTNQVKYSRKKAGDDEPRTQKRRGGPPTDARGPKKQRSSQEEKKTANISDDEEASTRGLPEALPPPEHGSSPAGRISSIPHRLGSSPLKSRDTLPKRMSTLDETPGSGTQIQPFEMPDLLDSPFGADVDWTTTPTAATSRGRAQKNGNIDTSRSLSPVSPLISQPGSPLSNVPSSPIELPAILKPSICPLCKEEVDRDLLTEYENANPHRTLQSMKKFCIKHKKCSAKEVWVSRGYPDIAWWKLNDRIEDLYPFIRSILQGKKESHYAAQFREKIKWGGNKTLATSDENLTPGYYGIRGLRQMSENLIHEFSSVLRKRALEDSLVSARGYMTYLQAVLVPELATKLVMEDMDVGEAEAREILAESSSVGELLNDEIADVVLESESDEED